MRKFLFLTACAALVNGCATKASKVDAAYVSSNEFPYSTCEQLVGEAARVESDVNRLTGKQNKKAKNDKIATGVGLVVFWPALFFLASDDEKQELAVAKGRYEAINRAYDQKFCAQKLRAQQNQLNQPQYTRQYGNQPNAITSPTEPYQQPTAIAPVSAAFATTTNPVLSENANMRANPNRTLDQIYDSLTDEEKFFADAMSPTERASYLYNKR